MDLTIPAWTSSPPTSNGLSRPRSSGTERCLTRRERYREWYAGPVGFEQASIIYISVGPMKLFIPWCNHFDLTASKILEPSSAENARDAGAEPRESRPLGTSSAPTPGSTFLKHFSRSCVT